MFDDWSMKHCTQTSKIGLELSMVHCYLISEEVKHFLSLLWRFAPKFLSQIHVAGTAKSFVSLICHATGVSWPFSFFYKQSRCVLFAYGCARALILTKVHALGSPVARYVVFVVGQLVAWVKGRSRLVKLAAKKRANHDESLPVDQLASLQFGRRLVAYIIRSVRFHFHVVMQPRHWRLS